MYNTHFNRLASALYNKTMLRRDRLHGDEMVVYLGDQTCMFTVDKIIKFVVETQGEIYVLLGILQTTQIPNLET